MTRTAALAVLVVMTAPAASKQVAEKRTGPDPAPGPRTPSVVAARLSQRVTLTAEGATVGELLGRLATAADVTFVAPGSPDWVALCDRKVKRLSVKDVPLSRALDDLLRPLGATYKVRDDHIELRSAPRTGVVEP